MNRWFSPSFFAPARSGARRRWLPLVLAGLSLGAARIGSAGGVTLITHGFNSDVASWIVPMQGGISTYGNLSPTNTTCYEVEFTSAGGGAYNTTVTLLAGTNPVAAATGEILIKLNWSSLSGLGGPSTLVIATNTANALLNPNLIPALGGRPLVELPLHLAGHSRGASVVAETVRLLGAQGVWVDHFTGLDPVPVSSFGDPPMQLYGNIFYADNYWQNLNAIFLDPQGQALSGAYNRKLTNLSGAASSADSDVHLWYHGTIDFRTPLTVDGASISNAQRTAWWTPTEQQGTNAGFRWSLIGGGDRFSTNEPAGAGNGRINDGVNRRYDFGAGLAANRTVLPVNQGAWPNPILFTHSATNPLPAGAALPFSLHYQTGTNATTLLTLALDPDANPWNGNETLLLQSPLAATGTNQVLRLQTNAPTGGAMPGTYRLLASVTASGRTRHLHAAAPVTLVPGPQAPWLTSLGLTNGSYRFRVNGQPGQTVITEASTNLFHWSALGTNVLTSGSIEFTDLQTTNTAARYFRAGLAAP
jgi:hypothetical protein